MHTSSVENLFVASSFLHDYNCSLPISCGTGRLCVSHTCAYFPEEENLPPDCIIARCSSDGERGEKLSAFAHRRGKVSIYSSSKFGGLRNNLEIHTNCSRARKCLSNRLAILFLDYGRLAPLVSRGGPLGGAVAWPPPPNSLSSLSPERIKQILF